MKRPQEFLKDVQTMQTLVGLTDIFESIASMHIAQIKSQVLQSQAFFNELWPIYTQLRVGKDFHFGQGMVEGEVSQKELLVIITAEGGFSGDIDQKLVSLLLSQYDPKKHEIIVVGHHGAVQLAQAGVRFKKYYKLPTRDRDINVSPIVQEIQKYQTTSVYYQTYVSLMVQDVKRISLSAAVQEYADKAKPGKDEISEKTYIFEPSTYEVVDHLERTMLHIALSQTILDSKLAQYASRFRAMSSAHQLAEDSRDEIKTLYNRSKRAVKDERLKEIMNGLRKAALA
jgi:ATP synthase F1 gamma subunit